MIEARGWKLLVKAAGDGSCSWKLARQKALSSSGWLVEDSALTRLLQCFALKAGTVSLCGE